MDSVDNKPKITTHQLVWVVAWVVLITILVLVANWLFRSPKPPDTKGDSSLAVPGKVTDMEAAKNDFKPEGGQGTTSPAPSPQSNAPQVFIPPPKALSGLQVAQTSLKPEPPPVKGTAETKPVPEKKISVDAPEKTPPKKTDIKKQDTPPKGKFNLQVGNFGTQKSAEEVQKELAEKGFKDIKIVVQGGRHKVLIAGFKDRDAASAAKAKLVKSGFKDADKAFPVESK